ncbi:Glyoxalase family protein [Pseudonocardia sp. Ae168_Ps1]|nr:Glyoxalase family protein [Pseudonocardia sp. Ae150A_Ps1]OLL79725.1 Glyoxalase family protein [Pseudonocardia sp. Ae168_Ps1]OLL86139.1 Glyoxalase family protein [Pseudonocardia sp. Ae263_Ps1]OLL93830.1 Glyoxalase family protein [Pseudonocardia sp. Ae356_Ps1]
MVNAPTTVVAGVPAVSVQQRGHWTDDTVDRPTMDLTTDAAKAAARSLRADLAEQHVMSSHARALELVAHQLGFRDWNTASAVLDRSRDDAAGLGAPVPILRVQRFDDVRSFYLHHLGFVVEWEHRFEPGMPIYARLARGATRLDLSEHHGDGTPGSAVWVPVADVTALHRELRRTAHPSMRPGIEQDAPGGPTLTVIDPSGNTLRFCEAG